MLLAGAVLAVVSCSDDVLIGHPLSIEITGPTTGLVGNELFVQYDVKGRRLNGVIFTWGDGAVDSLAAAGAQTAQGSRPHTYEAPGQYTVRARVEDAVEGVQSAEVTINIQTN